MRKLLLGLIGLLFAVPAVATDSGPISSVTVTGLVAQNGTPTPTTPIDIVSNNGVLKVSRNLFDENSVLNVHRTCAVAGTFPAAGTSENGRTYFMQVEPNTTYTVSMTTAGDRLCIFGINSVVNPDDYTSDSRLAFDRTIFCAITDIPRQNTFTTNANERMVAIYYALNTIPTYFQIELGSTATPYMPYGEIYTDGEVETIADSANHAATVATLLGVGDYSDTQNINTGAITRNVGVKVLDGTENWKATATVGKYYLNPAPKNLKAGDISGFCTHYPVMISSSGSGGITNGYFGFYIGGTSSQGEWYIADSSFASVADVKTWLSDQYAAGTPVIVIYPLATPTTESVAGQTMTTAPVNNRTGGVTGMTITTLLSSGASVVTTIANNAIKIATTAYNSARFSPVVTELNTTIATIRDVVTNTINQTKAIADLQATKQTRPDEQCPAGKKCLLVEDNDGTPHWYEIIENAD